MSIQIRKLSSDCYRILDSSRTEEQFLFRYNLIPSLPEGDPMDCLLGFPFETNWEGWKEERACYEEHFRPDPNRQIEGRPGEVIGADIPSQTYTRETDGFALRIPVNSETHCYGLGEGSREHLCLNGGIYQNFARYQFDEIPVPFLMSDKGWGILLLCDRKHFVDINADQNGYLRILGYEPLDLLYLQGTLTELLSLYSRLTGKAAVLPKWAYTLTYIAPIFARQSDVLNDAERMRKMGIPCHHFSLEPGWMSRFYDTSLNNDWCLERFHMPKWYLNAEKPDTFISALKRMGIHLSLWYCIDYDFTDEAEREAGFREKNMYEPWYQHMSTQVKAGVDGFKLDPANMLDPYLLAWNQITDPYGTCANGVPYEQIHNITQLLLAKQIHEGFVQQTGRRPMLHYCGGYLGIQRWSAATTGDNGGQLGSMVWLMTLAMSGQTNTTVDMNIFHPESQHFAFFAPWAHLNAWTGVRQPWYAGKEMEEMFVRYAQLRARLLPYIYSAALEASLTGIPIIRPLPLAFPGYSDGIDLIHQYMFGADLMVGAYTEDLHLPDGLWLDVWTGSLVEGGRTVSHPFPKEWGGQLLIREGSILPLQENEEDPGMVLHLFPGRCSSSSYTLYEDDGETEAYLSGSVSTTDITMECSEEKIMISIGKSQGSYNGKQSGRLWKICLHDTRSYTVSLEDPGDHWKPVSSPKTGLQL